MAKRESNWENLAIGLAAGFAAGLVVGILTAPEPGEVMRGRISDGAAGLRSSAREALDGAREALEQATSRLEGLFGTPEKQLRERLQRLRAQIESFDLGGA